MGDEKQTYFTVQLRGKAYRFKPIPNDDLERVVVVGNMSHNKMKVLKAMMHVLERSAGEEQWSEITDRLISGELTTAEVSYKLFQTLQERAAKAAKKSAGAAEDDHATADAE